MSQYFVDLDKTVADNEHRATWLTKQDIPNAARWDKFFTAELVRNDTLIPQAAVLDRLLGGDHHTVIFLTARPEKTRQASLEWLEKAYPSFDAERHKLVMKPNKHFGNSASWKVQQAKDLAEDEDFFFIDDDINNRIQMQAAFPKARVLEPLAGWEHISAELENTIRSEDTSENTADTDIVVAADAAAGQEDYSDMD